MNKKEKILLGFCFLISLFAFFWALNFRFAFCAPQYNETEIRNDFTNDDWFVASDSVIRNNTLSAYQLNATSSSMVLKPENTGNYTEVDGAFNAITVLNSTGVEIDSYLDETAYLYRDRGVNYFEDIHATAKIDIVSSVSNGQNYAFSFCNETNDWNGISDGIGIRIRYSIGDNKYQIGLAKSEGGASSTNNYLLTGTPDLWVSLYKKQERVWLEVYSNAARTVLLTNITNNLANNDKYRYVMWGQTVNVALSARQMVIRVYNLKYDSTKYPEKGFLFFKNLLENTTSRAVWYLSNQTLNSNTLQVAFSEDNTTWVCNTTLKDGLEAVWLEPFDLNPLYVKYRFMDGVSTPYLWNASIIYYGGGGSTPISATPKFLHWLFFVVIIMIGVLIASKKYKY